MKYDTLSDACYAWVNEFNAIPTSVIEKLIEYDGWDSVHEITPLTVGNRVVVIADEDVGEEGEIIETKYDGEDDLYVVRLDCDPEDPRVISADCLDRISETDKLPVWGWMWTFGDDIDKEWLLGTYCPSHLQDMADCGFRIYEQEDFGVLFGLDGGGYDFYEKHWQPLYKARGLHWHNVDDTEKENTYA